MKTEIFKNFLNRFPPHLLVTASAWISRIITSLIGIISVRTLLLYLGEERYAVYAIVYSLSGWFALCDFGMGAAIQNFVSECRASNKNYNCYLAAALQVTAVLFIVFIAVLFCFSPLIQNKLLSNYLTIDAVKNTNIIFTVGIVLILTIFANIVYRVYYALQKGYISNILPAISMIISMSAIVVFNRYYPVKGNILAALLIFTIPQLFVAAAPFIKIFKPVFSDLANINYPVIKELMTRSFKFSGFAIMATLTLQIDYIIMSQTLNAAEITTYNILNKIFMLFLFINSAAIAAAWPVFSDLNIKRQYSVIKKMIAKYTMFGIAIVVCGAFIFYIFSNDIIKILAPNTDIKPALTIFILFAIYYVLRAWSDTFSMFLQSINILKIFWIFVPFQAAISIIAQYFLSLKYGVYGIISGLILSFVFTACWALPYKSWKVFKSKEIEKTQI